MLLTILDADGNTQVVVVQNQGPAVDWSDTCAVTNTSQQVMAANPNRAGLLIQNKGAANMTVSEVGDAGTGEIATFVIVPDAYWPPPGYPVPTTAINIAGTATQTFAAREW